MSSDIDNNLSSSGNFSSSIILKEEFDEASEPTPEEIRDYASRIGIDPDKEPHLLKIARDGLMRALPSDWQPCFEANSKALYYINQVTKKTQWEHPLDAEFKALVNKARRRHADLSAENVSELDSGIRSLQGNEEGDTTPDSGHQMRIEQTAYATTGLRMGSNRDRIQLAPISDTAAANRFRKFEVTRATFEQPTPGHQISLAINTADKPPKGAKPESPAKKGFTLMGGGSLFLKSTTKPAPTRPIEIERPRDLAGVKGILREPSLGEIRRPEFRVDDETDKKFVRFNLENSVKKDSSPESAEKTSDASTPEEEQESDEDENWDFEAGSSHVKQVKVTPAISPISHVTQLKILQSGNHASETIKKTTLKGFVPEPIEKPSIFGMFEKDVRNPVKIKPMYDDASDSKSEESSKISLEKKKPDVAPFELEMSEEYKNLEQILEDEREKFKLVMEDRLVVLRKENQVSMEVKLKAEEMKFKVELEAKRKVIEEQHLQDVLDAKSEAEAKLTEIKMGIKQQNEEELEKFRTKLQEEFEEKRKQISEEYRNAAETLQRNHNELHEELERDLKMEQEIIKKEHSKKLLELRATLEHEIEVERQRMRETGEDRLYEKIRCEKRLLEDKYRCLKEKYGKLKNDIRISMERKKGRRTEQSITTTVSETASTHEKHESGCKPPMGIVSSAKQQLQLETKHQQKSNKNLKCIIQNDDTTSISQSDTTISNQFTRRNQLTVPNQQENNNSDSEAFDSRHATNNNNVYPVTMSRQKRRIFTRSKSASTSRLHTTVGDNERPSTPVENLRTQLQKLEDLEDEFPENTLDTPYKLRYPFTDIGNQGGASSELEFFKHRIHLEKDSVRRAKDSLRSQRTNFRAKQREIKQRHISAQRNTADQLFFEEKELTEMEVSLHRTRALLGEKVIRLRHLEHSLQRLYEKEKPFDMTDEKLTRKEDATLSDVSSSSGFSSSEFHTDNASQKRNMLQESTEIMQSLENLNAEIHEIWDILSKQQSHGLPPPPPIESDIKWTMFGAGNQTTTTIPTLADRLETYRHITGRNTNPFITTASSVANTIVSQAPLAAHYTTSLVERTRDLRNWLKQAKTEAEINALGQQTTI